MRCPIPVYDYICSNSDCKKETEKIVRNSEVETIDCPECGSVSNRAELGFIPGNKRHVMALFNYLNMD